MNYKQLLENTCDRCINEGELVISTSWTNDQLGQFTIANPTSYVDLEKYTKWRSNCLVLINLMGTAAKPWEKNILDATSNKLRSAREVLGTLRSIKETIQQGLLIKIEEIILAEAFSNLIEQAEYLLEQNYILAAGVILRAVLEEKLRSKCHDKDIKIQKERPTLGDYNTELYKANIIDKIYFKRVESLIAIENAAAHNNSITKENIVDLLNGTKDTIIHFNMI